MRLIKLKEVINLTALSRSAIYRKMETGDFPKSVNLGERSVAWVEGEIFDWIEQIVSMSHESSH